MHVAQLDAGVGEIPCQRWSDGRCIVADDNLERVAACLEQPEELGEGEFILRGRQHPHRYVVCEKINAVDERYLFVAPFDRHVLAIHVEPATPALAIPLRDPRVLRELVHLTEQSVVYLCRRYLVLVCELAHGSAVNVLHPQHGLSLVAD